MYPVLALLAVFAVPMSLFVGLWSGSPILAVGLPFVTLIAAVILAFVAEDKASKDF
jgi:asparagine N-glycosylation enzyme membrane subunit Stt3